MPSRRTWLRQPLSWRRGGAVALAVVGVLIVAALMLDAGSGAELEPLETRLRDQGRAPVEVIEAVGRAAQVVLLSDIHGHPGPKRLAAEAIRLLAEGAGLDAVVLEVPSDEQPFIDAYLARAEDDATVLLGRPGAVPEEGGIGREYLEIYRMVWRVNQEVGAARRIRILAADHPDWPPPEGVGPHQVATLYTRRARHMMERMDQELFALMPDARVLVFVDGYQALQRTNGRLRFAGGADQRVEWLGELLRQRAPAATRTILVDAAASPTAARRLPRYHGTQLHRPLRRTLERSSGVRVDGAFGVVRAPVLEASSPGLRLEIEPRGYTLPDVADAYIFLRGAR
jgi:hypothetical protein